MEQHNCKVPAELLIALPSPALPKHEPGILLTFNWETLTLVFLDVLPDESIAVHLYFIPNVRPDSFLEVVPLAHHLATLAWDILYKSREFAAIQEGVAAFKEQDNLFISAYLNTFNSIKGFKPLVKEDKFVKVLPEMVGLLREMKCDILYLHCTNEGNCAAVFENDTQRNFNIPLTWGTSKIDPLVPWCVGLILALNRTLAFGNQTSPVVVFARCKPLMKMARTISSLHPNAYDNLKRVYNISIRRKCMGEIALHFQKRKVIIVYVPNRISQILEGMNKAIQSSLKVPTSTPLSITIPSST